MNLILARTFLEILETGNLNRAAERLNVTQSTVTMRLNALEDLLGQKLLVRNKSGVALTNSGFKFQRYAEMLVQIWREAQLDVALPQHFAGTFNLGLTASLWEGCVQDWLPWLRDNRPDVALSVWTGDAEALGRWLGAGLIDAAVSFGPQTKWETETQPLFNDRLILVSREERALMRWHPDYIYVDWGEAFRRAHALAYPYNETAAITFGDGALALQHILAHGGSGYVPLRAVWPHLKARRLFAVVGAPAFSRQVLFSRSTMTPAPDWLDDAVAALRGLGTRFDDIDPTAARAPARRTWQKRKSTKASK